MVEKIVVFLSDSALYLLLAGALYLLILICLQEGRSGLIEAFNQDIALSARKFLPIVAIFLIIAGAVDHLARKNPEKVRDLIAGKDGQAKMYFIAMILPGPAGANQLRQA